ncbi:membrane transporter [Oryctes borbonicus]|uniref:Membrane transporter n=1 Tax=Oryctes borbonicus TaxID=1629725 RepID=A0A0T6BDI0_9SCAR|nr:membrane transporter [Oryctes borbonicus]
MESTNNLVTQSVYDVSAKKTFKSMTFREKLSYIKTVITVEPLIAFYFIPSVICYPALYTLELEKACRVNGGFNDTICDYVIAGTGEVYEEENVRVQQIIANMHSWQNPMQNFVPIILILFLASYSDRHKIRKPFLLLPIVGEFFAITGCILSVVFMRQLPIEVQGFSQTVVPSFLGGSPTLIMAVFAYISDVSTLEMRTLRIGLVQILLTICSLLSALGGYLFEKIGYYGVLGVGGALYLLAFFYGVLFVKENKKRPKYEDCNSLLKDIFNPRHAIDTLKLLADQNKPTNYKQLYLVLIVFFISALVIYGK